MRLSHVITHLSLPVDRDREAARLCAAKYRSRVPAATTGRAGRRPLLRTLGVGACVVIAGCRATPPADTTPPAQTTAPNPPALIAACCGYDDASIMTQIRRYETTAASERPPELAMVPYRLTSGITRRDRIVIEDAAAWARIWPTVVGSHSPRPPLPAVDFEREAIVIASMGGRSSGGFTISIDSARVAGDTITLVVTERSPGRTCGTTAALTSPIALARVTRPRVPIRFAEQTAVTDCD